MNNNVLVHAQDLKDNTSKNVEAYEVNSQSYNEVEENLATDFGKLGLNKNESYILVVEGEQENSSRGAVILPGAETEFKYTYNGSTYDLRYLTVTAADNSSLAKHTEVNVLNSAIASNIQNCLDTVLSTLISKVNKDVGTVASLLGFGMPEISTNGTAKFEFNGDTNWTKIYTQVKSPSSGKWINGCVVERVQAISYMSGKYYSASSNQFENVEIRRNFRTEYSSNYGNHEWRKMSAVQGYLNSTVYKNLVSKVQYKCNQTVKITHYGVM